MRKIYLVLLFLTISLSGCTQESTITCDIGQNLTENGVCVDANPAETTYTIVFESNSEMNVDSVQVREGEKIIEPNHVIKEGYTFLGWYLGNEEWIFSSNTVSDNITLSAQWSIDQHTISFNSFEGTTVQNISQDYGTQISEPQNPTKPGFTFEGWYIDSEFTTVFDFDTMPSFDVLLYAKWSANLHSVTYYTYDTENVVDAILLNAGERIVESSMGYYASAAITSDGRVFTWGLNRSDRLGYSSEIDRITPTEISSIFNLNDNERIINILFGYSHSVALTTEGRVFTWGSNGSGQLGNGVNSYTSTLIPEDITSNFNLNDGEIIVSISCGNGYSSAITNSGRVFTWGENGYGQLGDGTTTNKSLPTNITSNFDLESNEQISLVSSGYSFSIAVTSSNRIFSWGHNNFGQLGDGTNIDKLTPTEITTLFDFDNPLEIVTISAGYYHAALITNDNNVFMWGLNHKNQLGDDTTINKMIPINITNKFSFNVGENIASVSLGQYHSSLITSEGRLYTWGDNYYYQCGTSTTYSSNSVTEITSRFDLDNAENIISVSFSGNSSSAITTDGKLFLWGSNYFNELADPSGIQFENTPTSALFFTVYSSEIQSIDNGVDITNYNPTRDGYIFDGWYSDLELTNKYTSTDTPLEDITLYGKWIKE